MPWAPEPEHDRGPADRKAKFYLVEWPYRRRSRHQPDAPQQYATREYDAIEGFRALLPRARDDSRQLAHVLSSRRRSCDKGDSRDLAAVSRCSRRPAQERSRL